MWSVCLRAYVPLKSGCYRNDNILEWATIIYINVYIHIYQSYYYRKIINAFWLISQIRDGLNLACMPFFFFFFSITCPLKSLLFSKNGCCGIHPFKVSCAGLITEMLNCIRAFLVLKFLFLSSWCRLKRIVCDCMCSLSSLGDFVWPVISSDSELS